MSERKLACVRQVDEIRSIEGADAIEAAIVGGWQVVVKKGTFKPGDLGVFFEIDAVPPDQPEYRFLWQKSGEDTPRPRNFRIRTKKLRGCLSQGLLLPFSEVPTAIGSEGSDLTEFLGVTKYEPPEPGGPGFTRGRSAGNWPGFCPKTDEERIQNCKRVLEELRGKPYVMTLKLDGTSFTCGFDAEGKFHVCSRNLSVKKPEEGEPSNVYWDMAKKYNLERVCREHNVAIQGEICGPGIQGNKLGLKEHDLFVFTLFRRDLGRLPYFSLKFFCEAYDLKPVPLVESGDSFDETLDSLLAKAEGKYEGTQNEREGLVVRSRDPLFSEVLRGNLSFKVISNRFLLKEKD